MKKLLFSIAFSCAAICAVTYIGCKKKSNSSPSAPTYSCAGCITTPEAKAANDNSSKGVYKGVIVGSSGTIKFDIMNNDSTIKAYMVIDGVKDTLTASVAWTSGSSYVSPFTGMLNGSPVSITFSIDANGGNPTITSMNIPGHPDATLTLSKETSTNLIECFEGTVRKNGSTDTATFDLILSNSLKKWQARVSGSSNATDGTLSGNTLSFDDGHGTAGSATLSGDMVTGGTWHNDKGENGTFSANRTL